MSSFWVIAAGIAVLVVIAAAVIAVVASRSSDSQTRKPADSETTPNTAWDYYVAHPQKWSDRDRRVLDRLTRLDPQASRPLLESLGETVEEALAAPNPQAGLRKAIMDATDRFVMAESLYPRGAVAGSDGADSEMSDEEFQGSLEAGVLRCFSMLRFRDYSKDDWYPHYLSVAQMNCRNVASMVQKTVRGEQSSLETSLHGPLSNTMRQVREALLHHPSQTPVKRSDKLTTADRDVRVFPSQREIDRVTKVVRLRFEKLFSGQMYHLENGTAVSPVDAFRVDAALLYTILSLYFSRHDDAWRQIMDGALGHHKQAMDDEQELLDMGRDFKRLWVEHERDGPLRRVLETACGRFEKPAAAGAADSVALAKGMMEDASFLVRSVREAVGET